MVLLNSFYYSALASTAMCLFECMSAVESPQTRMYSYISYHIYRIPVTCTYVRIDTCAYTIIMMKIMQEAPTHGISVNYQISHNIKCHVIGIYVCVHTHCNREKKGRRKKVVHHFHVEERRRRCALGKGGERE